MTEAHPYAGMTINERLVVSGLLSSFDVAVRLKDRAKMIRLLAEVGVEDAAFSVDTVLKNPGRYGY